MRHIRSFDVGAYINVGDATICVVDSNGDSRGNYAQFSSSRYPYMSWVVFENSLEVQKCLDIGLMRVVIGSHFWASMICGIMTGWRLHDDFLIANEGGGSINLTNGQISILDGKTVFGGNFIANVVRTTNYMPSTYTNTDAGSLLTNSIMMELKALGYSDIRPVACNRYEAVKRKKFHILNVKIVDGVVSVD